MPLVLQPLRPLVHQSQPPHLRVTEKFDPENITRWMFCRASMKGFRVSLILYVLFWSLYRFFILYYRIIRCISAVFLKGGIRATWNWWILHIIRRKPTPDTLDKIVTGMCINTEIYFILKCLFYVKFCLRI